MTQTKTEASARTHIDGVSDLGTVIRERRTKSQLTQDDVARALGVHRRYIYELERGGPDMRLERTLAALELLGVRVKLEIDGAPVTLPQRRSRSGSRTAPTREPQSTAVGEAVRDEAAGHAAGSARRSWRPWGRSGR